MFRLTIAVPYEGDSSEDYSSLEEVCERIKQQSKDHAYDDMEVLEIVQYHDVYQIMNDWKQRTSGTVYRKD